MFDTKKALENARQKLGGQQQLLKDTLAELDYVEKTFPTATAHIKSLRTKRDRQAAAVRATEEVIEIYTRPDPAQLTIDTTSSASSRKR